MVTCTKLVMNINHIKPIEGSILYVYSISTDDLFVSNVEFTTSMSIEMHKASDLQPHDLERSSS